MGHGRRHNPHKAELPPVSLGATANEGLPYPLVHYPNHYGAFFAFAKTPRSLPVFCECSESPVRNFLRLRMRERTACPAVILDDERNMFVPKVMLSTLQAADWDPNGRYPFKSNLCHRCNQATPSLIWSHPMYGGQFMQSYGWYVQSAYFWMGIHPYTLDILEDVCPEVYQRDINELVESRRAYSEEYNRLMVIVQGPRRPDIPPDEVTFWHNVREEEAQDMIRLRRRASRANRAFTKKIEDIARQEFGFRKVGEGWVGETLLFQIVCRLFPGEEVLRHERPDWLNGLELDLHLPARQLAMEYQGQQHFHPVELWGGNSALSMLQERDARKRALCENKGVTLIEVDYTEPLTDDHVRERLREGGITGCRTD